MWSDEVKHGFVVAAATGQDEAAIALEMRTGALDPHPTKAPFDPTPTTLRRSRGRATLSKGLIAPSHAFSAPLQGQHEQRCGGTPSSGTTAPGYGARAWWHGPPAPRVVPAVHGYRVPYSSACIGIPYHTVDQRDVGPELESPLGKRLCPRPVSVPPLASLLTSRVYGTLS